MAYATGTAVVRGTPLILKASAAETATTAGAGVATGPDGGSVLVTVAITAASGTTPTMTVAIEGSVDGSTWVTLGTFGANGYVHGTPATPPTNFTTTASKSGVFPSMPFVRYSSTIGGTTPSFTYSVTGAAV
jgi:hypothetical protein